MENGKKGKILKILIILTIVLIWGQSLLPPDMSSGESGFVLEKIIKPFLRFITGREAEISEHLVRKLAHFTEFMVLGLLVALYRIPSFTSSGTAEAVPPSRCGSVTSRFLTATGSQFIAARPLRYPMRGRQGESTTSKAYGLRATAFFFGACVLFCFFIAFIDESIQMFTGRGPAIADVWIDTGGAVTGIGIEWIIEKCTMRNA